MKTVSAETGKLWPRIARARRRHLRLAAEILLVPFTYTFLAVYAATIHSRRLLRRAYKGRRLA